MARILVDTTPEVIKNFESFIQLRNSSNAATVDQYRSLLKRAKVLVVEKIDGKREYAPSRFVGYKNNTLSKHSADDERDGRVTTSKLEKIYDQCYFDEAENTKFASFCKKHGIDKDVVGLNRSLKFIFSASYPPSATAVPVRTAKRLTALDDDEKVDVLSTTPTALPNRMTLNQILYGPPGTGKTYHTIARAVALLEGISDDEVALRYPKRGELRKKFEEYRQAQRIGFVTFHQAFTYEDFVEGIKPLPPTNGGDTEVETTDEGYDGNAGAVQYAVRKGIFRVMCETAASAVPSNEEVTLTALSFEELYAGFFTQLEELIKNTNGPVIFRTKEGYGVQLTEVNHKTGRLTFQYGKGKEIDYASQLNNDGSFSHVDKSKTEKLFNLYSSVEQIKNLKRDITDKVGGSAKTLQWVVFKELKKYEASQLTQQRGERQTKPSPPFVLIIDEINRGNVANIFGELITLLEDDKRAGRAEALTITLPYSQEDFSVPQNLYVLGTMNTADRSVEALDTALRRRFSFTEMSPVPELLRSDVESINLQKMLRAINSRLEQLLDRDHCIGHALLMQVTNLPELREAFQLSILPLLREYFFGDWGKIGLVIGGAFITQVNKQKANVEYPLLTFEPYQKGELSEKPVFSFTDAADMDVAAFQKIYGVA